ncbi:MAG: type II toxin-antitoxin system RelE/ParE family toxin [Candidatus Latescibacteria bacterium]|nr:type II toxin-antitoxin system RelE/ParE family toxin [Candidatus Latescibacterota bacterium]
MGQPWRIVYYETREGRCPVEAFIRSQKARQRAKILNWIELLENSGPQLPRPYADLLTDGIHELRIKVSGDQIRILYFFCYKNYIVLTHPFTKGTSRVSPTEIAQAQHCRDDFLKRFTETSLTEAYDEDL